MSRADWSFLEHLLEEGQEYSTGVGRVWLTVLFLFRMLILGTAAESAWGDEQEDFLCNTRQPGCTSVCYDMAFPISHFRYFVLQVVFVSTPTIFYFGYVAMRAAKDKKNKVEGERRKTDRGGGEAAEGLREKKMEERKKEEEVDEKEGERRGRKSVKVLPEAPKLKGRLLCAYAASILLKLLLETSFIAGLWLLYGGLIIHARFECVRDPCPHMVDCFVSRPTEKTIFTIYTQVIAAISLLLNLVELFHLLQLAITYRLEKFYRIQDRYSMPGIGRAMACPVAPILQASSYQSHLYQPEGREQGYPQPCESYVAAEVTTGDLLPSYLTCMGGLRTTHSPRTKVKKHTHITHDGTHTKGSHKGHSKPKHYV
ncbi:gap junction protein alpha 4 [Osmerus mordax]|uniref:gap junction protein alpha 4 n=1 Tax=Osmerus mordax TaxID=8014 RepID=UPI003510942B